MTFRVAHWDTLEVGKGEDVLEHTNDKCHVFYIVVCKRKISLSILMASIICLHFGQLLDHCTKEACTS
jgi:hypothetical protein